MCHCLIAKFKLHMAIGGPRSSVVAILLITGILSLLPPVLSDSMGLRFHERLQKGEESLKALQLRASGRGSSSSCWQHALQTLIESCKAMDENLRSKFAVQLANCHLQSSGLRTVQCTTSMSVLECTAPLAENPIAFNTYTEFFIHSDHICYYIESENLQQKMENTVAELLSASLRVSEDVHEISDDLSTIEVRQHQILNGQYQMAEMQQTFAERTTGYLSSLHSKANEMSRDLTESLAISTAMKDTQTKVIQQLDDVQEKQSSINEVVSATRSAQDELREQQKQFALDQTRMHSDVSERVEEILGKTQSASSNLEAMMNVQSKSFSEALDVVEKLSRDAQVASRLQQSFIQSLEKVITLQEFLLGEVFDMKAVAFYLVSVLVAILFTSCERVAAARFWLFVILSGSFVLERLVVRYYLSMDSISATIWICRKITCVLSFALLLYFSLTYRDASGKLLEMMNSHDAMLRYLRSKEEQKSSALSELVDAQRRLLDRCDLLEAQSSTRVSNTKTRTRN